MLQDKQVHSYVVVDPVEALYLVLGCDPLLGDLIGAFDLIHEPEVGIVDVALFENDWGHLVLVS